MHAPLLALLLAAAPPPAAPVRTLRVDFFHTGDATHELFAVDRLVIEPAPWPGNPKRPFDDTGLGNYFLEVKDAGSGALLYSRGFSSIYGEWEDTPAARERVRTLEESLRFPLPGVKVEVTLKKRSRGKPFAPVWSFAVDPRSDDIDDTSPPSPGPLMKLMVNGPPSDKVDLLLLCDGYTAAQRADFERDARRLMAVLFATSPFRERRGDFNVWGLCAPSSAPGISRPSTGIHHRSRVGATYDAFGSERYILTFDNRSFRDVASFAPYDFVEILVNGETYGGGGIFGLYGTAAAKSLWAPYVFVHEFGHHFAGLADEYFTSESALLPAQGRPEPWEPNVTALADPAKLKWQELVTPGTPVPTPWKKPAFETRDRELQAIRKRIRAEKRPEKEMDALFQKTKEEMTALLGSDTYAGAVGAFEGAMYESSGYYRPQEDCIMFTRNDVPFCRVCQRAISQVIDLYSSPAPAPMPSGPR
ncbi:MAG TPA: M64 family metallopeptidase [Myxococcaceae bacterium]|nr:M64 family metallopeptidase [Myxococcaceae bacterium]